MWIALSLPRPSRPRGLTPSPHLGVHGGGRMNGKMCWNHLVQCNENIFGFLLVIVHPLNAFTCQEAVNHKTPLHDSPAPTCPASTDSLQWLIQNYTFICMCTIEVLAGSVLLTHPTHLRVMA